ncbi:TonB-dependent receptor [Myroides sp. LJL116]
MERTTTLFILLIWSLYPIKAQIKSDTIIFNQVLTTIELNSKKTTTPTISIDQALAQDSDVTLIKRGAYAWEPMINNMGDSRITTTIDQMRIFKACTDNMDPVTSYVEVPNLEAIAISNNGEGSGVNSSFAGAIDLQTKIIDTLQSKPFAMDLFGNYQSNNQQKNIGASWSTSAKKIKSYSTFSYKKSANYKAGHNVEIENSQFEKYNASTKVAYTISENKTIESNFIWDRAQDVGYPALPMDVSLAQAFIGSLSYNTKLSQKLKNWQTKLYYNTISHTMDDSKRKEVAIRMDMPGKSTTVGILSTLEIEKWKNHSSQVSISAFENLSQASMVMYPNDPMNKPMFMYTWGDIEQQNIAINIKDTWKVSHNKYLNLSAGVYLNKQGVYNKDALESLKIFYPLMSKSRTDYFSNLSFSYHYKPKGNFNFGANLTFASREFSASESYGYYIFNSHQNYDYLGNPFLKKEWNFQFSGHIEWKSAYFKTRISMENFYLKNYIIGVIQPNLRPMTIGAIGVKKYDNLSYALQNQFHLHTQYLITAKWKVLSELSYYLAKDNNGNNLPFISPLQYKLNLHYNTQRLYNTLEVVVNGKQSKAATYYGETAVPSFGIINLQSTLILPFQNYNQQLKLTLSISNLLDTYYTTYANWNHLPQMGRNMLLSVHYAL